MPHVFDHAASGRSKCRGCRRPIAKGEVRFGESLPNPFAEGEVIHWFHPLCAAYKRPDALLDGLAAATAEVPEREALERIARQTLQGDRLARIDGAELSPTSLARCRECKQPIEKATWRIRLVLHEEGAFAPGGFIHLACRRPYFGKDDIAAPLLHFSGTLDDADREALRRALDESAAR